MERPKTVTPTAPRGGQDRPCAGVPTAALPLHEHGYAAPAYLQSTAALAGHCKLRSYEQMRLQSGQRVLDVGCGTGIDLAQLATHAGPSGSAVGVDADPDMARQAGERLFAAGHHNAVVVCAPAQRLPFESGEFDAVRSERMFQHLDDPAAALAEMVRVTRMGGRVVVLDTDWGSLSMHLPDVDLERCLVAFKAGRALRNGYSGRRLFQLMQAAKLQDVSLEVLPLHSTDYATSRRACALDDLCDRALAAGVVSARQIAAFHAAMQDLDAGGGFYACVNMVLVAGTRIRHAH